MGEKLSVRNLGSGTDSAVLETIFGEYGTVESAEVIVDRKTGRSQGFVEMSRQAEADAATSALDGEDVGGHALQVTAVVKPWAEPGEVVNLQYPKRDLTKRQKNVLVQSGDVQIIQFMIPAGARIPMYQAQGEVVLHCLAGHVDIIAAEASHLLEAGQFLYLVLDSSCSIQGIKNASLLATIILPMQAHPAESVDD